MKGEILQVELINKGFFLPSSKGVFYFFPSPFVLCLFSGIIDFLYDNSLCWSAVDDIKDNSVALMLKNAGEKQNY